MTIRGALPNARRRAFDVQIGERWLPFPYVKASPAPSRSDPVVATAVDPELAREAFAYRLQSGREGTVHIEQVLGYNRDPAYEREQLLYRLSVEAQRRLTASGLAKREVIRRLGTSPSHLYRLLDQTNYGKSVDQMLRLLRVLGCAVRITVEADVAYRRTPDRAG